MCHDWCAATTTPKSIVVTGMVRLRTVTVGDFDRVVFLLDDKPIFAKRAPPYSVELDLGEVPSAHRLRANGYNAAGEILATDEILMNPGGQRFRVSLSEPQSGRRYRESLRAAVQVAVPDGEELDRIELYLNETRVATLYQPPFVQPILLGNEALAYVRAVGYLKDGNSSEDLVFVNAEGEIDEINVHFVELYAAVYDSLAYALHYFHGIRGQRALLLLSDGEDESSGFDFEDALEFARRAGVQIYVIGLKEAVTKHGARKVLKQFARETGGRSFFVEDLGELTGIYAEIQAELRSQYLFAYQSTSTKDVSEFRTIEVEDAVDGKKAEVRTMSGYYP